MRGTCVNFSRVVAMFLYTRQAEIWLVSNFCYILVTIYLIFGWYYNNFILFFISKHILCKICFWLYGWFCFGPLKYNVLLKIGIQRQNRHKYPLAYIKTNRFITFLLWKKLHMTNVSFSENDVTFMLSKICFESTDFSQSVR